jgi:putative ABC transport system permease protein
VQPGFTRPSEVQILEVSIPEPQVREPQKVLRMQNDMLEKIQQIPGVRSAAFTSSVTMTGEGSNDVLFARDRVYREGDLPPIRRYVFISPGLHKTMGTPLIAGRDFTWTDVTKGRQSPLFPKVLRASIGAIPLTRSTNRSARV